MPSPENGSRRPPASPITAAVPHVRAALRRSLDQEVVEPTPLGHEHDGPLRPPLESRAVAQTDLDALDDVLHDGVEREREEPRRAAGDPAAAGLVAREDGL